MSERPSWFRCDASRLLGALGGMGPDCGYLYTVILMRIYEVGGPIEDDCGTLARRTGMALRRVTGALTWLLAKGKVERLPDGLLDSETTHEELARQRLEPPLSPRLPMWQWIPLRASIFERDGFSCTYCGTSEEPLECDHIFPVSRGGDSDPSNLTTACFDCNRSKGAKTLAEWRQ